MEYIIISALALFVLYRIYKAKHPTFDDIVVPPPAVYRKDLYFGYFGAYDDQATETLGSVNLWWECGFQGEAKAISNILTAKVATVLSCGDPYLYERFQPSGRNWRVKADAETLLRGHFQALRAAGALQYVKVVVPFDEPNTNVAVGEFQKGIDVVKKVAAEFSELADLKLATIYAFEPTPYDCIEQMDFVGIDDYSQKSAILTNGAYGALKAMLRPDQKTILVPGGCFGQDPTPFVNFAESNPEVAAVLGFVWFKAPTPADVDAIKGHPWVGIGETGNPLKETYLAAGKTVINGG